MYKGESFKQRSYIVSIIHRMLVLGAGSTALAAIFLSFLPSEAAHSDHLWLVTIALSVLSMAIKDIDFGPFSSDGMTRRNQSPP